MGIKIESIQTDTCSMRFFRFGKGERPLVILPGLSIQSVMDSADTISAAFQLWEDTFTIFVFDRRTDLPSVYSVQDIAHDTASVFQALGLKNVCLFGASQGGMIALVIAIEYPDLVRKMVLGSTSAHVQTSQFRVIDSWIDLAKRGDKEGLYLEYGKEIYPSAVFSQYRETLIEASADVTDNDLERFIILADGMRDFNVSNELHRIKCPVLAIGAFDDDVLDSDATMEIAEKLDFRDDFMLYMYNGFGHAVFDTAPDYRERVKNFFMQ